MNTPKNAEAIKSFIATELTRARSEALEEAAKAVEEYFRGLVAVTNPPNTGHAIVRTIRSLKSKEV